MQGLSRLSNFGRVTLSKTVKLLEAYDGIVEKDLHKLLKGNKQKIKSLNSL